MISPLTVGAAATEVTRQSPAFGERSRTTIRRLGRARRAFAAGGDGECTSTLDEEGVDVRGPVALHLRQRDRSPYEADVTPGQSQCGPLKIIMAERPELLPTERDLNDRLVRPLMEGVQRQPSVAAGGRMVQLVVRSRSATWLNEEARRGLGARDGRQRTTTWPAPGGMVAPGEPWGAFEALGLLAMVSTMMETIDSGREAIRTKPW